MLRNASTIAPGAAQDQKDRETIDQLTDRGLAALGHEPMPVLQRYYVFGKPAGVEEAQYAGWPADMLARAARMARRETRP